MDGVPQVDYLDTSTRPTWLQLPGQVRAAIGELAGSPVASADPPPRSGFSGAFAASLVLDDGRRVFAKAGSEQNPHVLRAIAREATVLAHLPAAVPAPRLVGGSSLVVDDRRWQVLVLDHLPGRIPLPWTERTFAATHEACLAVVRELTPAPVELSGTTLSASLSVKDDGMTCAARLAAGELALTWGQPSWLPTRLDDLATLVERAPAAVEGCTGCHGDLRADNVLVSTPADRPFDGDTAVLVDWNWLRPCASWVDVVGLLPVARADGVDADAWVARSPLTRRADPDAIDAYLAYVVSYMLSQADAALWPGVRPAVRVHQRRYARLFADWLGARRGWL